MKPKLAWFFYGFISAIILLAIIGYFRNLPRNVAEAMPKEQQEAMSLLSPWITSAKSAKLGPFAVFVPGGSSQKAEAIMHPIKTNYPQIIITDTDISFVDVKNKIMRIKYRELTGEFEFYDFSSDLLSGISFIDSNLDGQYDMKIGPGKDYALYYNSRWLPLIKNNNKKYIEIDGTHKEIEIKGVVWKIAGQ